MVSHCPWVITCVLINTLKRFVPILHAHHTHYTIVVHKYMLTKVSPKSVPHHYITSGVLLVYDQTLCLVPPLHLVQVVHRCLHIKIQRRQTSSTDKHQRNKRTLFRPSRNRSPLHPRGCPWSRASPASWVSNSVRHQHASLSQAHYDCVPGKRGCVLSFIILVITKVWQDPLVSVQNRMERRKSKSSSNVLVA